MKALARAQGLWNLWISPHLAACMAEVVSGSADRALLGAGLSNLVRHRRSPRCRALPSLQHAQSAGLADWRYLVTEQTGYLVSAAKPSWISRMTESHMLCCGGRRITPSSASRWAGWSLLRRSSTAPPPTPATWRS